MTKRCFLCGSKMDEKTGLCINPKCVRSKPLAEKAEVKEGAKVKANESERDQYLGRESV